MGHARPSLAAFFILRPDKPVAVDADASQIAIGERG
jgi:hypothetical protein